MYTTKLHNAELARRLMAIFYDWLLVLAIMMAASVPLVAVLDDSIDVGNPYYQAVLVMLAGVFLSVSGDTAARDRACAPGD